MSKTHVSVHGIELHYEIRGAGEPLLLLHGFTGSSGDWVHLFAAEPGAGADGLDLLARAHRLVLVDLRGHGASTNPSGELTHRQCALDVLALLDHEGIWRCRALGVSLGGNTLLHLATHAPERVEAMVLAGATTHFPPTARAIMRQLTEDTRSEEEWRMLRAIHHQGDEQIRALWKIGRGFADSHDDLCFGAADLGRITARTLIVNGDRDPLYPVEISVALYRGIPDASLWVVPGAGHAPVFGAVRGAFTRAAIGFLSGGAA